MPCSGNKLSSMRGNQLKGLGTVLEIVPPKMPIAVIGDGRSIVRTLQPY